MPSLAQRLLYTLAQRQVQSLLVEAASRQDYRVLSMPHEEIAKAFHGNQIGVFSLTIQTVLRRMAQVLL